MNSSTPKMLRFSFMDILLALPLSLSVASFLPLGISAFKAPERTEQLMSFPVLGTIASVMLILIVRHNMRKKEERFSDEVQRYLAGEV